MISWNKMSNSKKLSVSRIKNLLSLFKFIVSQKSNNKTNCISFLNENSIDEISESIYNILYNEKLNTNLSKSQKAKLRKIIQPNSRSFEEILNEKFLWRYVDQKLFNRAQESEQFLKLWYPS